MHPVEQKRYKLRQIVLYKLSSPCTKQKLNHTEAKPNYMNFYLGLQYPYEFVLKGLKNQKKKIKGCKGTNWTAPIPQKAQQR